MGTHLPPDQLPVNRTIFDVLAGRARSHGAQFLAVQAGVCTLLAVALLLLSRPWWPLSSLLLAVACYSLWGIQDSRAQSRPARFSGIVKGTLVTLATIACLATAIGTAFALFAGDSTSPYGTCSGADGRAYSCDSRGQRR